MARAPTRCRGNDYRVMQWPQTGVGSLHRRAARHRTSGGNTGDNDLFQSFDQPPQVGHALIERANIFPEPTNIFPEPTNILPEPTNILLEPTNILLERANILLEPTKILLERANILLEPTNILLEPTNILLEPTKILLERANILLEPTKIFLEPAYVLFDPAHVLLEPAYVLLDPAHVLLEPAYVLLDFTNFDPQVRTQVAELGKHQPSEGDANGQNGDQFIAHVHIPEYYYNGILPTLYRYSRKSRFRFNKGLRRVPAILIMATVKHRLLSPLSKAAGFEAKMSRNIDFCALLAPAMAGKTFVAFDQPT